MFDRGRKIHPTPKVPKARFLEKGLRALIAMEAPNQRGLEEPGRQDVTVFHI